MDDLVLPDAPITNYNTRYSGITPEMMAPVTRSLADAQRTLFSFMGPHTLLVRTDGGESPSCSCGGFGPWVPHQTCATHSVPSSPSWAPTPCWCGLSGS